MRFSDLLGDQPPPEHPRSHDHDLALVEAPATTRSDVGLGRPASIPPLTPIETPGPATPPPPDVRTEMPPPVPDPWIAPTEGTVEPPPLEAAPLPTGTDPATDLATTGDLAAAAGLAAAADLPSPLEAEPQPAPDRSGLDGLAALNVTVPAPGADTAVPDDGPDPLAALTPVVDDLLPSRKRRR